MKNKIYALILSSFLLLNSTFSFGQDSQKAKLLSYQLNKPYNVEKIVRQRENDKPKNIILMIGDGMSLSIMYTAWVANHGHLNIEQCEYVGLYKTYSANRLITDSGAGATAFGTGYKTNNGSVGVDATGNPHKSILKIAKENQLSTGLIATCSILDATPAAFIANIDDRDKWDEIALDYVKNYNNIDYVFGGGWKNFENRKDGRPLIKEIADKGFQMPKTVEELEKIKAGKVFALVAGNSLPLPKERGDALSKATMKAIELLSQNEKGFFLMVEGSMIDDQAHENNIELLMNEAHDFDRTVGEVFKWAAEDGETLVIVTADHETGGLTLLGGDIATGKVKGNFSTDSHSGVMVPVYSFGPRAENFTGIFENTDLFNKMLQAYDFKK